jgi:hypothetical protein
MARMMGCSYCKVELETVKLDGARAMVVCVACEQLGFADEVLHGAPLWPAELGVGSARRGWKTSRGGHGAAVQNPDVRTRKKINKSEKSP